MTTITYPNSKIIFTDVNGNTGTTILANSITSPFINTTSLITSNGKGNTGNILSTNGSNLSWVNSSIISTGSTSTNINMNNNNITANTVTTTNLNVTNITSNSTTFANQISFTIPPISTTPTTSTQLATKDYIDTNLTTKLYNLYLNTQPITVIGITGYQGITGNTGITGYSLSNTLYNISSGLTGNLTTNTILNTDVTIAKFISNEINIRQIPNSLWTLNIYGTIDNISNIVNYKAIFELYSNGSYTLLGTSNNSTDHIALTSTNVPYNYILNIRISSPQTTLPTDRIIITLYAYTDSASGSQIVTYFKPNYYSYAQLQVSNSISSLPIPKSILWNNTAYSDLVMNTYNITGSSISCPSKTLTVGNNSSTINIGTVITATRINLGSTGGSIFLNSPLTPTYTTFSTTGSQIGFWDNYEVQPASPVYFPTSGSTITRSVTVGLPGIWLFFFTGTYQSNASSIIQSSSVIIKNFTTNTFICQHQQNMETTHSTNQFQRLHCSGIVVATSANTQIDITSSMLFTTGDSTTNALWNLVNNYTTDMIRVA